MTDVAQSKAPVVRTTDMAEVVVDVWRIQRRASQLPDVDGAARILVACERAVERLEELGFVTKDLTGCEVVPDQRIRVVEHVPGGGPRIVQECLTPAVYYNGVLVRVAEAMTKGGDLDGSSDC